MTIELTAQPDLDTTIKLKKALADKLRWAKGEKHCEVYAVIFMDEPFLIATNGYLATITPNDQAIPAGMYFLKGYSLTPAEGHSRRIAEADNAFKRAYHPAWTTKIVLPRRKGGPYADLVTVDAPSSDVWTYTYQEDDFFTGGRELRLNYDILVTLPKGGTFYAPYDNRRAVAYRHQNDTYLIMPQDTTRPTVKTKTPPPICEHSIETVGILAGMALRQSYAYHSHLLVNLRRPKPEWLFDLPSSLRRDVINLMEQVTMAWKEPIILTDMTDYNALDDSWDLLYDQVVGFFCVAPFPAVQSVAQPGRYLTANPRNYKWDRQQLPSTVKQYLSPPSS